MKPKPDPLTREKIYERIIVCKAGDYLWQKFVSADDHNFFIEILKEIIRFKIDFNNGFSLMFNDDYSKFRIINLHFPSKVFVGKKE